MSFSAHKKLFITVKQIFFGPGPGRILEVSALGRSDKIG